MVNIGIQSIHTCDLLRSHYLYYFPKNDNGLHFHCGITQLSNDTNSPNREESHKCLSSREDFVINCTIAFLKVEEFVVELKANIIKGYRSRVMGRLI